MSQRASRSLFLLLLVSSPCGGLAPDSVIRIGVLSHRGDEITQRSRAPTAHYLSAALPGYEFRILPLTFSAVEPAVATNRVDFILVNPGSYVNLEVRHRVSRIATNPGISHSTLEAHRARVMEKREARSLSDLMRMMPTIDTG